MNTDPTDDPPADPPAIRTRGLEKRFGDLVAVSELSLTVARGEALGLLGPNGAGKSTTVRILSTLALASAGEVRVLGLDPGREGTELRRRIGVVPQELALYDELSAAENLRFFGGLHGLRGSTLSEAVAGGIATAGLEDRAGDPVKTFSGGMKRRLNIAAALLHRPELVFLDEPTVGIDPQSRNRIFEMVEGLHAAGTTLVYTSHQLGEVERLCDRIVILDRGRQVAGGTLPELQRQVGQSGGAGLHFAAAEDARRAEALLVEAGLEFQLREEAPGLEAVFLELTGHALRDGGDA